MPSVPARRPPFFVTFAALLSLASSLVALAGCAHRPPPVQPWQREHLSKRAMRLDAPGELEEGRFRDHWYTSREGSALGQGSPGGGCGCN